MPLKKDILVRNSGKPALVYDIPESSFSFSPAAEDAASSS
jgi:hypothetical protein